MPVRTGKSLTALLQTALLLAVSLAPPGVRHSHSLGERVAGHHRHAAADGHVHNHHHVAHRHPGSLEGSVCTAIGERPGWHLHLNMLGFEMTLPDPLSSSNESESSGHPNVVAVAVGREVLSDAATLPSSVPQGSPLTTTPTSQSDAAPMLAVVWSDPPVSCTPLCDRARHERSGVLLA